VNHRSWTVVEVGTAMFLPFIGCEAVICLYKNDRKQKTARPSTAGLCVLHGVRLADSPGEAAR
jgi:hypothetical protein